MNRSQSIRSAACDLRRSILAQAGVDSSSIQEPERLVNLAADHFDLLLTGVASDAPVLQGSVAVLKPSGIFFNKDLEDGYRQYSIAHEIGHHVLHKASEEEICTSRDIAGYEADDSPSAAAELQGYSPHEMREREANLFALELILPLDVLRKMFFEDRECVASLLRTTKLPTSFIFSQLSTAVLAPVASPSVEERNERSDFDLDASQRAAASIENGPVLIAAGPGTGKTQTLVKRILFLLNEKKISPDRILALTFSNKATREMSGRIAEKAPDKAHRITVMTFHGYALEILRRYWVEAGLAKDSRIIDTLDAILHLEGNLDHLDLEYLQNLHDPAANLPKILTNISRAKDELIDPTDFRKLAEEQLASAVGDKDKERAHKSLECAKVYEFYQDYLEREKLLDYGEIIVRAVRLIQSNEAVRNTLKRAYDAILVDEFQDINRASGVLVKEIAGDGKGLWAVGDLRQSIYRWRGASPNNIKQFDTDYPGAQKLCLERNYRSGRQIVGAFSEFARSMKAVPEPEFPGWTSESPATASITYHVSGDDDSEAQQISFEAKRLVSDGVPFRNQAVICRNNNHLNAIAAVLVRKGVPVLFLGDLFEREEIRDLLSIIDLLGSETGTGLVRAARLPEFGIPAGDVELILEEANQEGTDFQRYLRSESFPEGISPEGRAGLSRLRSTLTSIPRDASAFSALCDILFSDGSLLRRLAGEGGDVLTAQRLLAIYQLVTLARFSEMRFSDRGDGKAAAFLQHIRKIVAFRESKGFSQMPASVSEIDAVRLLTVHGSKGLEFDAVFVPYLATNKFPAKRQGDAVPAPKNLGETSETSHEEEEECLFFVAVSRARKFLFLSRAESYNGSAGVKPSPFLEKLGSHLPEPVTIGSTANGSEAAPAGSSGKKTYHISQIKSYLRCPREFYYKYVLRLEGKRKYSNPYSAFNKVVYDTLAEIQKGLKARRTVTEEFALSVLDELWTLGEMESKPYSKIYRRKAEDMVRIFVRELKDTTHEIRPEPLVYEFENGSVKISPHHLEVSDNGVLIREFKTGRGKALEDGKFETADHDEVLMKIASEQTYKGAPVTMTKLYLGSDTERPVRVTRQAETGKRKKFEETLAAIGEGRFEPKTSAENCPNCPYYFICPQ